MNQQLNRSGQLDDMVMKWAMHMPLRFRQGRMPYVFIMGLLLIATMVFVSFVTPYSNGVPVPMGFATVMMILLVAYSWGMPLHWAVHIGVTTALVQVSYAAWVSGGIFSPRLAWFTVIPLVPFYVIGRHAGLRWHAHHGAGNRLRPRQDRDQAGADAGAPGVLLADRAPEDAGADSGDAEHGQTGEKLTHPRRASRDPLKGAAPAAWQSQFRGASGPKPLEFP